MTSGSKKVSNAPEKRIFPIAHPRCASIYRCTTVVIIIDNPRYHFSSGATPDGCPFGDPTFANRLVECPSHYGVLRRGRFYGTGTLQTLVSPPLLPPQQPLCQTAASTWRCVTPTPAPRWGATTRPIRTILLRERRGFGRSTPDRPSPLRIVSPAAFPAERPVGARCTRGAFFCRTRGLRSLPARLRMATSGRRAARCRKFSSKAQVAGMANQLARDRGGTGNLRRNN
jgi:hypothetical protein